MPALKLDRPSCLRASHARVRRDITQNDRRATVEVWRPQTQLVHPGRWRAGLFGRNDVAEATRWATRSMAGRLSFSDSRIYLERPCPVRAVLPVGPGHRPVTAGRIGADAGAMRTLAVGGVSPFGLIGSADGSAVVDRQPASPASRSAPLSSWPASCSPRGSSASPSFGLLGLALIVVLTVPAGARAYFRGGPAAR
jgi:hypothetical protein